MYVEKENKTTPRREAAFLGVRLFIKYPAAAGYLLADG